MPKFSLDYNQIADIINKRKYALEDVKDKIVKVAFDIVRFKDSDLNQLWQIHHTDDGDYITALYDEEENSLKKAEESSMLLILSLAVTTLERLSTCSTKR